MIWWLAGIGALLLGGWGLVSTYRVLHPRPRAFARPERLPSLKSVSLVSGDGKPLDLWILDALKPHGVVIACHGYHANCLQLIEVAQGLCRRNYAVVLFDLRGHGARHGPCTFGINETEDIGLILKWLAGQPALRLLPVGLFGLSLGGAIACQAVCRYPTFGAIVVDSVYVRLFPILAQSIHREYHLPPMPWAWITWLCVQIALGRRLSRLDPLALAARSNKPLLAIHGADDRSVPVDNATALYAAWQGPKAKWIEDGVGHVGMFAHNPNGYCDRVAAFFGQWLGRASA